MPGLAVFDVDHTITSRSTGRRLVQCGLKSGIFRLHQLASLPYHYLRYRSGSVDVDRAIAALARLDGRPREELEALARQCFVRRILPDIMEDARVCIEAHRRGGDTIALATSSLGLIVNPLAEELGISAVLATELEFEGTTATGRLATPPCFGEEKRDRVLALASALRIPASALTFYSDSHIDLPLLRAVGNPVVVNPDRTLRAEAMRHGWDVVRFR